MLLAMVLALRPSWAARVRSMSAKKDGASTSCCRWASTMPGMLAMRRRSSRATLEVVGAVVADGAHVDLRRQAEIQDLGHHVGRLEVEDGLREGGRQLAAELAHIVVGRRVAVLQRHQDDAVVDADRRAVGEGKIVGACRQADVVDDQVAVALGDGLADLVLDLLEQPLGRLDARAGRRADMELDAAAVDHREEVAADHGEQRARRRASTATAMAGTMNRRRAATSSSSA